MKTFYHASTKMFSFPKYEECVKETDRHANGGLGFWFACSNTWIGGFGSICFSFRLAETCKFFDMPVGELSKWSRCLFEREQYAQKRLELLDKGYQCIRIYEVSGEFEMGIVLDFDVIENFTCLGETT